MGRLVKLMLAMAIISIVLNSAAFVHDFGRYLRATSPGERFIYGVLAAWDLLGVILGLMGLPSTGMTALRGSVAAVSIALTNVHIIRSGSSVLVFAGRIVYAMAGSGGSGGSRSTDDADSDNGPEPEKRPKKNSAGDPVTEEIVYDEDALLREAERAAGGNLDDFREYKPDWYQSPDGKMRIELSLKGHPQMGERPHVTIREFNGRKHAVIRKIFLGAD